MRSVSMPSAVLAALWTVSSGIAAPLRVRTVASPDDVMPSGLIDAAARLSLVDPSIGPNASTIFQFEQTRNRPRIAFAQGLNQLFTTADDDYQPAQFASIIGINSGGSAAFTMRTSSTATPSRQLLIAGRPHALSVVLSQGDTFQWQGAPRTVGTLTPKAFSRLGDTDAFALDITDINGVRFLAFQNASLLLPMVQHGGQAPGLASDATINLDSSAESPVLLNEHAELVFWGRVDRRGVSQYSDAIWVHKAGETLPFVVTGSPLNGTNPLIVPSSTQLAGFNNNGEMLFSVRTAGQTQQTSLILGNIHSATFSLIAETDVPIASLGGSSIHTFGSAVLSSNGDVAFSSVVGSGYAVIRARQGELRYIANTDATLPDPTVPQSTFTISRFRDWTLSINRLGQVAIGAEVNRNGAPHGNAVLGWDPQRGLSLLSIRNVPHQSTDGQVFVPAEVTMPGMTDPFLLPSAIAINGDTDGRRRLLSDSGEVALRMFNGSNEQSIHAATIPSANFGDANNDGTCNGRDLSVLLSNFGQSVSPPGSGPDFNSDGVVNAGDLSVLLVAFGN